MIEFQTDRRRRTTLIDDYCLQLGLLVERRHTRLALISAKDQAEHAAALAEAGMRQAQEADRAKTQFLANMTHELRTPLNAIIGFSEVIEAAPQHKDTADNAGHIREAGKRLLNVLNGVLDLARIEAGKLALDEQAVAPEELFQAATRSVRAAAAAKSIALTSEATVQCTVNVDPSKMTQVLVNLLTNAIKFTPDAGTVAMTAELASEGELVLRVRDSGCGIADDEIARIVQPFGQAEDHLVRQTEGIGLGLPIARALVRLHGGELHIESALGAGTAVSIRLPAGRLQPLPQ